MKKRTLALLFALIMLVSTVPFAVSGEKVAPELETDADGYLLINDYSELLKHLEAYRGQMIKTFKYRLNKDVHGSSDNVLPVNALTAEIDLNGYMLSLYGGWYSTSMFTVYNRGHLIISDSSEAKTGVVSYDSKHAEYVKKFDIDYDDDDGTVCAMYCRENSTIEIRGGTFRIHSAGELFRMDGGNLKIYDGVFENVNDKMHVNGIDLFRSSPGYSIPAAFIYGGTFRITGTPINIESSFGSAKASGSYPVVGVFGGEFYTKSYFGLTFNDTYANVVVYGGLFPKKSDKYENKYWELAEGALSEEVTVGEEAYLRVTHSQWLLADGLDAESRFDDALIRHYFSTIDKDSDYYTQFRDIIDDYLAKPAASHIGERKLGPIYLRVGNEERSVKKMTLYWGGTLSSNWKDSTWFIEEQLVDPEGEVTFAVNRPMDKATMYYRLRVEYEDGTEWNDYITLEFEKPVATLKGKAFPTLNSVRYGNTLFCGLIGLPDAVPVDSLRFEWSVDGDPVGNERTITLSDPTWIGKDLTVKVTSTFSDGTIISTPVKIEKAINNNSPVSPQVKVIMNGDDFLRFEVSGAVSEQEYLFSTKPQNELTDGDWENSYQTKWTEFTMDSAALNTLFALSVKNGDTVYLHTRCAGTKTTLAGSEVFTSTLNISNSVYLRSIIFPDAVNGYIYIPYSETESYTVLYDLVPWNANSGGNINWSVSAPLVLEDPTSPEQVSEAQWGIRVKATGLGLSKVTALYKTYMDNIYGSVSVVVYDPENVTAADLHVAEPLEDVTVYAGTGYSASVPAFIVEPTVDVEYKWYFTRGTMYGYEKVTDVGFATIDVATGEIITTAPGKVEVSLYADGVEVDSYQLTVIEKPENYVALEELYAESAAMTLKVGEKRTINVLKSPADASVEKFSFTSSAPDVAFVTSDGVVYALAKGEAIITVTAPAENVSTTIAVTVTDAPIPTIITGDVNGDGKINNRDVIALMKAAIVEISGNGSYPKGFVRAAADLTLDGKINNRDVVALMKLVIIIIKA